MLTDGWGGQVVFNKGAECARGAWWIGQAASENSGKISFKDLGGPVILVKELTVVRRFLTQIWART